MTLPILPLPALPHAPRRVLAALLTVAALSTGLGVSSAAAQTATAVDAVRYVPHGTKGRYEIARNLGGYLAGTLRPVTPAPNAATVGQIARQLALRGAVTAAAGAAAKVVVPVVVVAGGALLVYELVYGE